MEIDEESDSTNVFTENGCQITVHSTERIIIPQIKITEAVSAASSSKSICKRFARRNFHGDDLWKEDSRRIKLFKYGRHRPMICSEQNSHTSGKSHLSRFQKREITTIQEEVFQKKICTPVLNEHSSPNALDQALKRKVEAFRFKQRQHHLLGVKSKSKDYKEKVASLKVFIERLKLANLNEPNPNLHQNPDHINPDETIQLFEKIHI